MSDIQVHPGWLEHPVVKVGERYGLDPVILAIVVAEALTSREMSEDSLPLSA